MAHFEKVPERPSFDITDDYGHCANLTAEQAYDLLQWLYRSDELFQAVHPEAKQEQPSTWLAETHETMVQALDELVAKPEAVKAWQQAKPAVEAWQREHPFIPDSDEKPAVPTVRSLLATAPGVNFKTASFNAAILNPQKAGRSAAPLIQRRALEHA